MGSAASGNRDMSSIIQTISHFAGISSNKTTHVEKIVSGLGGLLGIFFILLISRQFLGPQATVLIVASMGASAVLLFAVPHGPLSQPWALVGGHLISAAIGVSCYLVIPDHFIAAATAVGLAITAMYYLRCIHPPGGATALTTVVAGANVHALGYAYMLTPVLLNVVVILTVAIVFNYAFAWRRYPAALMQWQRKQHDPDTSVEQGLSTDDLDYALSHLNLYVDIGNEELEKIYQLATSHSHTSLSADQIKLGHYYSNGQYGTNWSIRQIVDEADDPRPEKDLIIYRTVAGDGRRSSGTMSRDTFAKWARYEVYLNENSWQRVIPATDYASVA